MFRAFAFSPTHTPEYIKDIRFGIVLLEKDKDRHETSEGRMRTASVVPSQNVHLV